jgi:sulfite exporter TauE/SafE
MAALIISTFLASLLGSLHCAGMCGAFLAIAVSPSPGMPAPSRAKVQAAYHLGRLTTYILLGIAAGTTGALLNLGSTLAGIQPVAASLAGAVMIWFGVAILLRLSGVTVPRMPFPKFIQRRVARGHALSMSLPPTLRAGAIGLLTTLLPCGWLYAFAVIAAGTANPLKGGIVMAVFWVGTLPMLVALGTGLQHGLGAFGRRLPVLTSIVLILIGLYTLVGRSMFDARAIAAALTDRTTLEVAKKPLPCCEPAEAQ